MRGLFAATIRLGTDLGSVDLLALAVAPRSLGQIPGPVEIAKEALKASMAKHGASKEEQEKAAARVRIPGPTDVVTEVLKGSMAKHGASKEEQEKAAAQVREKAKDDLFLKLGDDIAKGMGNIFNVLAIVAIVIIVLLAAALAVPALFQLVGGISRFADNI